MLTTNVNITINGTSTDELGSILSNFNASYDGSKNIYFSMSGMNSDTYAENKTTIDNDYDAFTEKVMTFISSITDEKINIVE